MIKFPTIMILFIICLTPLLSNNTTVIYEDIDGSKKISFNNGITWHQYPNAGNYKVVKYHDLDGTIKVSKDYGITWYGKKKSVKTNIHYELFPNPSDGILTLNFTGENKNELISIIITKKNGEIVRKIIPVNDHQITIDVTGLQTGSYILTVCTRDKKVSRNFFKL